MKIRHIVSTRFLFSDFFKDGRIFEKNYQKKSFNILKSSFIKTLQNQTDKDFECVIITHPKCKNFVKSLNFPLEVKVMSQNELIRNIKKSLKDFNYIIHTTCDYDDFFHKDNLRLIKNSVKETTTFKMYGFLNGATLVYGENEPHMFHKNYMGKDGFFSCCTSIIYSTKLKFSRKFPYVIHDVAKKYNGNHPNWKHIIEKEYKNWGIKSLDEDFFDYPNESDIRFIWIRQPLSYTTIKNNEENKSQHYSDDIIELDLKNDFGYEC